MVVGQLAESRDLVVIGAGPGGYEAALHAAGLGRKVTLIDRNGAGGLGGECLHTGCIPSKMLIEYAAGQALQRGEAAAIESIAQFQDRKSKVIEGLRQSIQRQLERAAVEIIPGTARFLSGDRLIIERADGPPGFVDFDAVIVATGSRPVPLGAAPFDSAAVLDSAGALALTRLPPSVSVVGGGYIGVELGTALARLGVTVTIVEMQDRLLFGLDGDLGAAVTRSLRRLGVRVELGAFVSDARPGELELRGVSGDSPTCVAGDKVLVAVGRRANTDGIGLELTDCRLDERGLIHTDAQGRAGARIFAIGDVRPGPALAHKASAEARMVAEVASGVAGHRDVGVVPMVVFADPEVASVGLGAADAASSGGELVVGKVPLSASGRAVAMGQTNGFVRVVVEKSSGVVVGCQIAGPHAAELVAVAAVAIELGALREDLESVVFAHPTVSELLALAAREAAR
jgi:dihydrolipoamide dehydrogenase